MASLREIRRRIKGVESIHNITKAMQIISAVRYKKIEGHYKKAMPFFDMVERFVARVFTEESVEGHPLFVARPLKRELVLVCTGDRGLCGGFNTTVCRQVENYVNDHPERTIEFYPIGKIGEKFIKKRGLPIYKNWLGIGYQFTPESLKDRFREILDAYLGGKFDQVNILSSAQANSGAQQVKLERLLDLTYVRQLREDSGEREYIFEPRRKEVLDTLIDLYIRQRFFILILRSITAEYFARMVAMKQATDNGKEVIDRLTLERNKVRQSMITSEISEIIGGVNALS